jgi:hypothetical protein
LQSEKVTSAASIPNPKKKKTKTKNSNNGKRLEMEKIIARKIFMSTEIRDFQTSPDSEIARATHNFTTHQKEQKTTTERATSERISFINCKITVFGRRRKTRRQQQQQEGEASLGKTCSPNFLPRAALESAMQSERARA